MPRKLVILCCLGAWLLASRQAPAQGPSALVSESTAGRYGLHRAWAAQLEVAVGRGRLEWFVLQAGGLFAQTNVAMLQLIDPETGRSLWTTQVGKSNYPSVPVGANSQFVAAVNGSTLYLLDRSTGAVSFEKALTNSPSTGAAITADHVYVPMLNGAVDCYKLNPKTAVDRAVLLFYGQGAAMAPPVVDATHLMWGTDRGHIYVDGLNNSQNRIRFQVKGPVTAGLAQQPPLIFAGSEDYYAYAIDATNGRKVWDFFAGSPIRHRPVAIGDAVYIIPDAGGMTRLVGSSGRVEWYAPGVVQFVAASPTRIYASDPFNQLVILDAKSGARLAVLPTELLTVKLINTESDRIYMATRTGLTVCLREISQVKPLNYAPQAKKPGKAAPVRKKEAAPKEAGMEQPAAEKAADPFAK